MKGEISAVSVEGAFILRYVWKKDKSQQAIEYKMLDNICPEEAAHQLENFAAMLRDVNAQPISYE